MKRQISRVRQSAKKCGKLEQRYSPKQKYKTTFKNIFNQIHVNKIRTPYFEIFIQLAPTSHTKLKYNHFLIFPLQLPTSQFSSTKFYFRSLPLTSDLSIAVIIPTINFHKKLEFFPFKSSKIHRLTAAKYKVKLLKRCKGEHSEGKISLAYFTNASIFFKTA